MGSKVQTKKLKKPKKEKRTKIRIDYSICGEDGKIDPRDCAKCLKVCDPAVFMMHSALDLIYKDPNDPQRWRINPQWGSLCTHCLKCVDICPENAISITW
ncbi:MAG: 4Fe-4S dicluster domain-containing protein [Candidatus Lokiarchaeota archaeon]|nr:4Fe-4S dicluster domain-containing protein [Candidatus Lokiarchaeota archaeon]